MRTIEMNVNTVDWVVVKQKKNEQDFSDDGGRRREFLIFP